MKLKKKKKGRFQMLAERIAELVKDGSLEVIDETSEHTTYLGKKDTYIKCKAQRLKKVKGKGTEVKFGYCLLPRFSRSVILENGEKVKMKFHKDSSEGLIIKQLKN
tara:strand:+ start:163 stop:480 length:318 start_codon:yes stop_codon:yes gene_type:complete